jgi:hypothetical protein
VCFIIYNILGHCKVCVRWVPKFLQGC